MNGARMKPDDQSLLKSLLTQSRVLSLGVLVDGAPYVGLLPFVVADDFGLALVHASKLARHSRGLQPGAPYSALIHSAVGEAEDALQVARVTIEGTVQLVARADAGYPAAKQAYISRFPSSEVTFSLGDFSLYRLAFERGRLVGGFARAVNLSPKSFQSL